MCFLFGSIIDDNFISELGTGTGCLGSTDGGETKVDRRTRGNGWCDTTEPGERRGTCSVHLRGKGDDLPRRGPTISHQGVVTRRV